MTQTQTEGKDTGERTVGHFVHWNHALSLTMIVNDFLLCLARTFTLLHNFHGSTFLQAVCLVSVWLVGRLGKKIKTHELTALSLLFEIL